MDEDQTKDDVCYTKEQETATRNIIASGAGGMGVEHFIGAIAKGAATEIVSPRTTILQVQGATCRAPGDQIWT
jgi:hypothetical protein